MTSAGAALRLAVKVHLSFVVPKNLAAASVKAVEEKECAEGYSGWFTEISGVHVGSPLVIGCRVSGVAATEVLLLLQAMEAGERLEGFFRFKTILGT